MSENSKRYGESALLTPANLLTIFRLAVTPLFVWLIVSRGATWWTTAVGAFTAFTDYFDGIVARKYGTTTSGAFLDPLADKVVVLGSLYTLVWQHFMWWLPVVLITAREAWMSWYRSTKSRQGISIPATRLAKYKTLVQDLAIAFCVIPGLTEQRWLRVGTLWLAVGLTLFTGWQYFRDGRKVPA
jgi:CDP-diacylglycerol--glycerol-3-phosphate 3-phosphatidyltransferase